MKVEKCQKGMQMKNQYELETMELIVGELINNPRMDQMEFVTIMLEGFSAIEGQIEYDFNLLCNELSVRVRDDPDIAIDITWTSPVEVACELRWFMEHFL